MKLAVFDTRSYDRDALTCANASVGHDLTFFDLRLTPQTAPLADGFPAVCAFVNDCLDEATLTRLHAGGVRLIALRSAGFNHVDLAAATKLAMAIVRVPEYSPYAVAEHAIGLIMALNRHLCRAHARVREGNFALDGLVGFDLHGKTVGLIGTGRIGAVLARILTGFGCLVLAHDPNPDERLAHELGVSFVPLADLLAAADIISLHLPLTTDTHHLLDAQTFGQMKPGMMLINTSRGALIDTPALIDSLKCGQVGAAGLDVYEEEAGLFFSDLSDQVLQDDTLARLLTFPNVLITAHQAFLTKEALQNIAETTLLSVQAFERGERLVHAVTESPQAR